MFLSDFFIIISLFFYCNIFYLGVVCVGLWEKRIFVYEGVYGMTTSALVLGVISICFSCVTIGLNPIGVITGIIGITLGVHSIRHDFHLMGTARAGFICSIIGTSIGVLTTVFWYVIVPFVLFDPYITEWLGKIIEGH